MGCKQHFMLTFKERSPLICHFGINPMQQEGTNKSVCLSTLYQLNAGNTMNLASLVKICTLS